MARRTENMLEAFKVSREQAIEAQKEAQKEAERQSLRDAMPQPSESVASRIVRSLPGIKKVEEGGAKPVVPGAASGSKTGVQPDPARALVDYDAGGARALPSSSLVKEFEGRIPMSPWTLIGFSVTLAALSFVLGWQLSARVDRSPKPVLDAGPEGAGLGRLPDPSALPGQIPGQVAAEADPVRPNPADLAFADPSNHYTLVVDQHNDNRLGRERAVAQYQYLAAQGFPVVQPQLRGDVIYLLVGASPDREQLSKLTAELHALPYPGSTNRTFSSAYTERIENFF